MIYGPKLEFGPFAEFPNTRTVRKIFREGTNDWIGVLIEERMTTEEFKKAYPEAYHESQARQIVQLLVGHDVITLGKSAEAVKLVRKVLDSVTGSSSVEQPVDNRQEAGSTPAPSTKIDLSYSQLPKPSNKTLGYCDWGTKAEGAEAHRKLESCKNWHIDCPCWETGRFVYVEGCKEHPWVP